MKAADFVSALQERYNGLQFVVEDHSLQIAQPSSGGGAKIPFVGIDEFLPEQIPNFDQGFMSKEVEATSAQIKSDLVALFPPSATPVTATTTEADATVSPAADATDTGAAH